MAESVKVIIRCRPMNSREKDLNCKCVVFMDNSHCSCSIVNPTDSSAPPKSFTFDGVYHINSTTEQIYNEIAYPLVEGVLEGYNSTVFAYGQTGCGKSFTMQGVTDPTSQRGIIPRAFEHIFEAVSVAEGTKYLILASYLEIYNEEIRDLLGRDVKRKLDLKEHTDKGVYVQDLSMHPVQCVADCEQLMERGWKNRATGATLMNADSSRSHSIFSISLEMMPLCALVDDSCSADDHFRRGKLNLVDLAGSERQAKTGATGERLKEATKINLSLSALGNVISALVDGKSKHIPYRDSKLTRLLQDSLGGNTKTLMVACLSPADNNYDETLSTLRYANRAKNIQNKPRINEDPKDTMLREYQDEIKKLRQMLETSNITENASTGILATDEKALAEERDKVRQEYENEMKKMREQYLAEQDHKTKLQLDMEKLKQQYEEQLERINKQATTNTSAKTPTVGAKTPSELIVSEALKGENPDVSPSQQEIILRLQKLQKSMVGGERANDRELKEKRLRKKKAAERRLQALAKVLSKVEDDDGVFLQVYDDIQQELSLKTDALRKNKMKVRELEREISDLHCEFENVRTDYLETIRKEVCQQKLYQQIVEKMLPTLKKECNYSNLKKIMSEAVWIDESKNWRLPELIVTRTKLPPAGVQPSLLTLRPSSAHNGTSNRSSGSSHKSDKSSSSPPSDRRLSSPDTDDENKVIFKKLQRSEQEDIAGNYFKPKRAVELLNRAKEDASRAFSTWKEYTNRHKAVSSTNGVNNILNMSHSQNGFHSSLNALNLNSSISAANGNNFLNSSWTSSPSGNRLAATNANGLNLSPEHSMRRPTRLEALPLLDRKQNNENVNNKRKNGGTRSSEPNKMDII